MDILSEILLCLHKKENIHIIMGVSCVFTVIIKQLFIQFRTRLYPCGEFPVSGNVMDFFFCFQLLQTFVHSDKRHVLYSSNFASPMCREHYRLFHQMPSVISMYAAYTSVHYESIKEKRRKRKKDELLPLLVNWSKTLQVNWKYLTFLSVVLRLGGRALALFWFTSSVFLA